jgi:hypothetical protein
VVGPQGAAGAGDLVANLRRARPGAMLAGEGKALGIEVGASKVGATECFPKSVD